MVELSRSATEFNIARMRESFMRQFVDQGPEEGGINNDVSSTKDVAEILKSTVPERVKTMLPLVSTAKYRKCTINAGVKHMGVSDVIR